MVACKECNAPVSDQAKKCPHCGAKVPKPTSRITIFVAGLLLIGVMKCSYDGSTAPTGAASAPPLTDEQRRAKAKEEAEFRRVVIGAKLIKAAMKNPDSFKLESAIMLSDGTICYMYRGTNSCHHAVLIEKH